MSWKAELSIYWSIIVPTLTYGHEIWVVTERPRSQIQVAKMAFFLRVAGLKIRDGLRSLAICKELGQELLLLGIKRS